MTTTVVTSDSLELMAQLNAITKELLETAKSLREDMAELKLQTVKSPVLRVKEAAQYIGMSPQYLSQGRKDGAIGKRTPPPNNIDLIGENGKPTILYEIKELDRWLAEAPRRFKDRKETSLCAGS
jgi:hypothetical protein